MIEHIFYNLKIGKAIYLGVLIFSLSISTHAQLKPLGREAVKHSRVLNATSPVATSETVRYSFFIDPAEILTPPPLPLPPAAPGSNDCYLIGNIPVVTNIAGAGNTGCSQVFDNGTTTSIGNGSNATVTFAGIGHQFFANGTTIANYTIPTGHPYTLYVNGTTGSASYIATSDKRLKKNIKKIENPIEKIQQLSGYTYNWDLNNKANRKLDANRHSGLLAQEVLNVLPEAVVKNADGLLGLDYNGILPLLLEGIKLQENTIRELRKEVSQLTNKVNGRYSFFEDPVEVLTPSPLPLPPAAPGSNDCFIAGNIPVVTNLAGAGNTGCSQVYDNLTNVGIGVGATPTAKLDVDCIVAGTPGNIRLRNLALNVAGNHLQTLIIDPAGYVFRGNSPNDRQASDHSNQTALEIANLKSEIAELKNVLNQLVPNALTVHDNFRIIPNPITEASFVQFTLGNYLSNAFFVVYDLQGKMLKKYPVSSTTRTGQVTINKSEFGTGMYILALVSNNTEIQSKKFLIGD